MLLVRLVFAGTCLDERGGFRCLCMPGELEPSILHIGARAKNLLCLLIYDASILYYTLSFFDS
jgi:hypothetical protein